MMAVFLSLATFSLLPGIESQVTLWLSGAVVNWTLTSGGVDLCTRLFVNHGYIKFLISSENPQESTTAG